MRRKYLKGKFEDHKKYFKCPKCGFVMRTDRNHPSDRMSKTITEIVVEVSPIDTKGCLVLDNLNWLGTVKRYAGEMPYAVRSVKINTGCPFCGNVNF